MPPLFDPVARARAEARARHRAPSFLDERIWADLDERLSMLADPPRSALLLGPLTIAAAAAFEDRGMTMIRDPDAAEDVEAALLVRWAEVQDDLPERLAALAYLLPPNIPLLGCAIGGDSLGALRGALVSADLAAGGAAARAHPRLDPPAFAGLLDKAGFEKVTVDVDRAEVRYSSLRRLVDDLRDLGATNQLAARPRTPPGKAWAGRVEAAFPPGTTERFDLVHFSAWTAAS